MAFFFLPKLVMIFIYRFNKIAMFYVKFTLKNTFLSFIHGENMKRAIV